MSIGMKVPSQAHQEVGEQKKTWKNKKRHENEPECGEKVLPLQRRTTMSGL